MPPDIKSSSKKYSYFYDSWQKSIEVERIILFILNKKGFSSKMLSIFKDLLMYLLNRTFLSQNIKRTFLNISLEFLPLEKGILLNGVTALVINILRIFLVSSVPLVCLAKIFYGV